MLEKVILGIIQGVAEWLPISSEGAIFLAKARLFRNPIDAEQVIKEALFLHLGTFFAALIYFRKDVFTLLKALFNYQRQAREVKNLLNFLVVSTLVSGLIGILLIKGFADLGKTLNLTGKTISFFVGALLLITSLLQIKSRDYGLKREKDLKLKDGLILGFMQGAASLPGLSRSGLTVATLLLRKFEKSLALKLSFLMSLPIVLAGNIILNLKDFSFNPLSLAELLSSFVFGFLTINFLLKIAQKVNFGYLVLIFGILTIVSVFI